MNYSKPYIHSNAAWYNNCNCTPSLMHLHGKKRTRTIQGAHITFYWNDILNFTEMLHGENFMAIFTTLNVVIWFSTGTLGFFATIVYVYTMSVVIYDILSMAIIPTLSTSVLFCNLCYILLWILPRSLVKIAIRI